MPATTLRFVCMRLDCAAYAVAQVVTGRVQGDEFSFDLRCSKCGKAMDIEPKYGRQ